MLQLLRKGETPGLTERRRLAEPYSSGQACPTRAGKCRSILRDVEANSHPPSSTASGLIRLHIDAHLYFVVTAT
jgi:hypothetical protein